MSSFARLKPLLSRLSRSPLFGVGVGLLGAACGGGTGDVVVGVTTDLVPGVAFSSITIDTSVDGQPLSSEEISGADLELPLERTAAGLEVDSRVLFEVKAFRGSTFIVGSARELAVTEGAHFVHVPLDADCVPVECGEAQTCRGGTCIDRVMESPAEYDPNWKDDFIRADRCEPGGEPSLEIGTGQADYLPLEPEEVVQAEQGPQGGYHIWVAARVRNIKQSGTITQVSGTFPELDYSPAPMSVGFTLDPDEGEACKIFGLRFRLDDDDHPISAVLGQTLSLSVRMTDADGDEVSATLVVRISDDFI